ncbi:sensor domain-containing diguanylate cyclase [Peribacillus kribbensis]|uniref:sensor domain-containing diguanylate cyclase n=1 Tax=Peribacillus kribbensis TaxID=356658 RepID=UPI000410ECD4|nr:diguanylate cyclase [Peribacillus kribbensis]
MSIHKSDWICKLNRTFFQFDFTGDWTEEDYITWLLLKLREELDDVKAISYYKYNEWNRNYTYSGSAGEEGEVSFPASDSLQEMPYYYKHAPCRELKAFDLVMPLKTEKHIFGILAFKEYTLGSLEAHADEYKELAEEISKVFYAVYDFASSVKKARRYKKLFEITETFQASMDMDDVLHGIIQILKEVYPLFSYKLLLSHDSGASECLPIDELEYESEDTPAMQALLTGTIQTKAGADKRSISLYAPLKGRQGIYGVLKVAAAGALFFPAEEIEFVQLLAGTAGAALENAQLYQQSRRLISDLQLINETSHKLNSNLRLSETISYMRNQIVKNFGAQEIGFFMFSEEKKPIVLEESTDFFRDSDSEEYTAFITAEIFREREALYMGDARGQGALSEAKYRSVIAVPMIQSDSLNGFALVLHQEPYHFTFDNFKLLQSLIHHSTLAFANSMLREELEKMVITDSLTKLYSRGYLDEKLQHSLEHDSEGTFILLDIDNFKKVNDTYGHQVGDEVLVQVADLIMKNIRGTDIGVRWGGEELAIYLPGVSLDIGVCIAKRLLDKVKSTSSPAVTISCGISHWIKSPGETAKALFRRADEALYKAKNSGKNRLFIHEEDSL